MQIDFEITSYHRLSPEQNSEMSVIDSATFGRSKDNDWTLPDPDKIISGVHARVDHEFDGYHLYDVSTNGVFINRSVEALGADLSHKLQENDIVSIGDYEIVVRKIIAKEINNSSVDNPVVIDNHQVSDPIKQQPEQFSSGHQSQTTEVFSLDRVDTDLQDHFRLPEFSIPTEWDLPLQEKTKSVQAKSRVMVNEPITPPSITQPKVPVDTIKASAKPIASVGLKNKDISENNDNCHAFLAGLGISKEKITNELTPQVYFELGESMSLLFLGLINTLRNRSSLKSEFKINQTTFQHKENNPLKFSANIDDVFQNLFVTKSNSFLPAKSAIESAFTDIEHHDKALSSAGLGALRGLLKELEPQTIENKTTVSDGYLTQFIKSNGEANCWRTYKELHEYLQDEVNTQGNIALNDDFVKAYDEKIKILSN